MALNISDQSVEQAIIAAATLAGPGASNGKVTDEFWRILTLVDKESPIRRKLETVEQTKTVYGTLLGVDKEVTSNRGVVFLSTKPHAKYNPEGKDMARSDFLTNPVARDLMNKAKSLVGHRVALTLVVVETENNKAREIVRLEDQGVDREYDADSAKYQPSYDKLDVSKLASHGAKAA